MSLSHSQNHKYFSVSKKKIEGRVDFDLYIQFVNLNTAAYLKQITR